MRACACACVRAYVKRDKGEGGRVGGGREGRKEGGMRVRE